MCRLHKQGQYNSYIFSFIAPSYKDNKNAKHYNHQAKTTTIYPQKY